MHTCVGQGTWPNDIPMQGCKWALLTVLILIAFQELSGSGSGTGPVIDGSGPIITEVSFI